MTRRTVTAQSLHYYSRPHSGPPSGPIGGPAAWTAADMADTERWQIRLTDAEVGEVIDAVAQARAAGRPTEAWTAADLPLPTLTGRVAEWRAILDGGRGVIVLRGVPVDRWTPAEAEAFFWGFGLHLGRPGAQSQRGELIGHVRDEGQQTDGRLFRTSDAINYHCDAADVVGLLCLSTAPEGGRSRFVSSVAVFDALRASQPELAEALFEPIWMDTRGSGGIRAVPIEPCRHHAGRLRTFYHSDYFRSASRHGGIPALTGRQRALMEAYEALAHDPAFYVELDFAPGDIQLLSNHTVLHARGEYHDGPAQRRHLLRLWVSLAIEAGPGERLRRLRTRLTFLGRLIRGRVDARRHRG